MSAGRPARSSALAVYAKASVASRTFSLNFWSSSAWRCWMQAKRSLAAPVSSAPASTKLRMALRWAWLCTGVSDAGSMALYLAYSRSLVPRRVPDSVMGGVVGGPQWRGVGHAVQMADGAPGPEQLLVGHFQLLHDGLPAGREAGGGDGLQCLAGALQQHIDGGRDILRADAVEGGQVRGGQKGVVHVRVSGVCGAALGRLHGVDQ